MATTLKPRSSDYLPLQDIEKTAAKIEVLHIEDTGNSDIESSRSSSGQDNVEAAQTPQEEIKYNLQGTSNDQALPTSSTTSSDESQPTLHETSTIEVAKTSLDSGDQPKIDILPKRILSTNGSVTTTKSPTTFTLINDSTSNTEASISLDYALAVGGTPIFHISSSSSSSEEITLQITYSETLHELSHPTGDGPFFLFSNAMDTYRTVTQIIKPSEKPQLVKARFSQRSQRYQTIKLLTPDSEISFSGVGFNRIGRPSRNEEMGSFSCSDPLLNKIWAMGKRTVDMCTVEAGETEPAWDVLSDNSGTRVYGQHWAPCRFGTRDWKDHVVKFQVKIERGGASWGVRMVVNGLIFCIDAEKRKLKAFEGVSCEVEGVFPSVLKGEWDLGEERLDEWVEVETRAQGECVEVRIDGRVVAEVRGVDIHPLLGGAENNCGSVAFGGPEGWVAVYRDLTVVDLNGRELYRNGLLLADKERTFVDFAVGTNELACTIDGAKRDRATFGGDLHVMGRSIAYSTGNFDAVKGSIQLLTSHQTKDGYLGNLCPIQAPMHEDDLEEPPTYAFYSMTYALLLIVAIKDYWMHTGNTEIVHKLWPRLQRMLEFAESFVNEDGLVAAPPPLALTFFPLVGPVFGLSTQINLAFYDALRSMEKLSSVDEEKDKYRARADCLKADIVRVLWDADSGVLRLGDQSEVTGIAQDVNSYGISLGVSPRHDQDLANLQQTSSELPPAFTGLGPQFDDLSLCSPYSTGFAIEACFARGDAGAALNLIRRVWGVMADEINSNFSGCHWEAMNMDGKPYHNTTSLVHGWSTSPVYLLPIHLAGLRPTEAGWRRWEAWPLYAGLSHVQATVSTLRGRIEIEWTFDEGNGTGNVTCTSPLESCGTVIAP
ncbi:hypothetical protein HII31_02285 [Pseudocercospora fuligena]|uniref:Glycoside hydrolase family 78 protein n=1 Tax=Pseudocercospora fuligena TaxID=685502 RepID=A0A8H6RRY3_9PEZI|nr:hypothetical protein HII31_02285 [Pseudocercospora fuligena]